MYLTSIVQPYSLAAMPSPSLQRTSRDALSRNRRTLAEFNSDNRDNDGSTGSAVTTLPPAVQCLTTHNASKATGGYHSAIAQPSFSQFHKFPPEIRQCIWEFFCPTLVARCRVWELHLLYSPSSLSNSCIAYESRVLAYQMQPVKAMLLSCWESRAIAKKALPDTLSIRNGTGVVRFNKETDVILVSDMPFSDKKLEKTTEMPGFYDNIKHLAVDESLWHLLFQDIPEPRLPLVEHCPQLNYLYICVSSHRCLKTGVTWCRSNLVNKFHFEIPKLEAEPDEDLQLVYCWPNLVKHHQFAEEEVPMVVSNNLLFEFCTYFRRDLAQEQSVVELWPMVLFADAEGTKGFKKLQLGNTEDFRDPDEHSDLVESEEDPENEELDVVEYNPGEDGHDEFDDTIDEIFDHVHQACL
jgi:hypothetical protein